MTNTPHRKIRIPDDLWDAFGESVARVPDADRSRVLRQFMRWYSRELGVRLPERPLQEEMETE